MFLHNQTRCFLSQSATRFSLKFNRSKIINDHSFHSPNRNATSNIDRHQRHRNSQHIIYPPQHLVSANGNGKVNSIPNPNQLLQQQQQKQDHEQQIYKTTIPVNSHQCHNQNCSNTNIQMNQSAVCGMTAAAGVDQSRDVTSCGIPSQPLHCCCHYNNNVHFIRNSAVDPRHHHLQADGNPTNTMTQQPHTDATMVSNGCGCGGELTDGVAKDCKLSSIRSAHLPTSTSPSLFSYSYSYHPAALVDVTRLSNNNSNIFFENSHRAYSTYIDQLRGRHSDSTQLNKVEKSEELKNLKSEELQLQLAMSVGGRDRLGYWGTSGDNEVTGSLNGLDRMNMKRYNKGLAFTLEERQLLGIQGLMPGVVKTLEEQVQHVMILLDRLKDNLDKYIYLQGLAERNERLFYNVLAADIKKLMPLVYTPVVGLGCQKFSLIYQNPKGMYITIKDKGHVYQVLKNWPETDVRAIVVTDGERILGLGDLGANGMGIPVGKLSLYTALAGIPPHQCLPITLDVGTNTQSILDDPLYIGLRQKRVPVPEYDEFIEEFMQAVMRRYGQNCLVQFEDFGNANAFRVLQRYLCTNCVFNDDIQGTAAVALAGVMASLKIKNNTLKEHKILFFGAGEAALGIAQLCVMELMQNGMSEVDAKKRIWLVDSKGLIVEDRPKGGLTEYKLQFAHKHRPIDTLDEAVEVIKPSILIGASTIGGAFTPKILEKMAEMNDTPIIFALSNPTHKAECTAIDAYKHTKGKCLFASGSPFDPVEYNGKTYYTGQGNNSYIFPGVALGVICSGMLTIPEDIFLLAAKKLASLCTAEDLAKGSLYPPLSTIASCSLEIAAAIMDYAYENGLATVKPEPEDKKAFLKSQMYQLNYSPALPEVYEY